MSADTSSSTTIISGNPIVTFYFEIEDVDSEGNITFAFNQAYDSSGADYSWDDTPLSANYPGDVEEPTPDPETESSADAETDKSTAPEKETTTEGEE